MIVWTDSDGIHVRLGERDLPYLRWGNGGIRTLVDLAMRLGIVQEETFDQNALELLLEQWLPALQSTNLRIVVNFPQE